MSGYRNRLSLLENRGQNLVFMRVPRGRCFRLPCQSPLNMELSSFNLELLEGCCRCVDVSMFTEFANLFAQFAIYERRGVSGLVTVGCGAIMKISNRMSYGTESCKLNSPGVPSMRSMGLVSH